MPTKYNDRNDHYVTAIERDKLNALLRAEGLQHDEVAYQMRMTRSHVSGMLGGSKKMAHHHMLAIQFILLKHRSESIKAQRAIMTDNLTPEITI